MGQNVGQDVSGDFKHSLTMRVIVAARYSHTSIYLLSKAHSPLPILIKLDKIEH